MLSDRVIDKILAEIDRQATIANETWTGEFGPCTWAHSYEKGKEVGLRRAVSIIKKYQMKDRYGLD